MENHVAAPPPSGIAASSIRAALQKMLHDVELEKNGQSKKAAPTYANWRARSIIKEIASLSSTDALIEFERELRDVLYFQEIRKRTKLINEYLYGECNLIEMYQMQKREREGREAIELEWRDLILYNMHICQFMWDEEVCRHNIKLERRKMVRTIRELSDQSEVRVEEAHGRRLLLAIEPIAVEELRQRRLIEVGQEIHYEILRQNLMSTFEEMHKCANSFIKDCKALFRAEERDRIGIEKIGFLSYGVLMNEAESNRVRVLRGDIESLAQKKEQTDQDEAAVLAIRDQQQMIHSESQIRMMVIESEQEEWHKIHSAFSLGWRDVYQKISTNTDVVKLVSSLELFERRYIYDQYRHGMYGIESIYEHEHRIAKLRHKKYVRFFDDYLNGAIAIWKQENEQFNQLRDQFGRFLVAARAIQLAKVVILEETMLRRQIMGEEVRQLMYLKRFCLRDKCQAEAMQTIQMVMMHEDSEREQIMYDFQQQCLFLPQEDLRREEFLSRIPIETEENNAYIDLYMQFEKLQRAGAVVSLTSTICREEEICRSRLVENDLELRKSWIDLFFLSAEQHARRTVRRHEQYHRATLGIQILEEEDRHYREKMLRDHQCALLSCKMSFLHDAEEAARRVITKGEKSRRDFIVSSVPYEHLYLRACEVDELANRLHIINEAELVIRACAYTFGHDAPIAYCSEDLRIQQAQLRFQSTEQLLQEYQRQFIMEIEPMERQKIENEWSNGFTESKLIFEESRCRFHLNMKEKIDWYTLAAVATRTLGRQIQFEGFLLQFNQPPRLSEREQLLRFLQQSNVDHSEAYIRKKREAIRSGLSLLMEKLYWSRDAILREEGVERYDLSLRLRQCVEEENNNRQASSHDEDEQEEENTESGSSASHSGTKGCSLELAMPAAPMLFVHSVVALNPQANQQRAKTLRIRYSDETECRTVSLRPFHVINVGGRRMEVVLPTETTSWLPEGTTRIAHGVVFFTVLDGEERVLATGSHLLHPRDAFSSCISVELDDRQGRIQLTKHVIYQV